MFGMFNTFNDDKNKKILPNRPNWRKPNPYESEPTQYTELQLTIKTRADIVCLTSTWLCPRLHLRRESHAMDTVQERIIETVESAPLLILIEIHGCYSPLCSFPGRPLGACHPSPAQHTGLMNYQTSHRDRDWAMNARNYLSRAQQ